MIHFQAAGGSAEPLYLYGVPGRIGGASTKIAHLIRLLHGQRKLTVILPSVAALKDRHIRTLTEPYGVQCITLKDLSKKLEGLVFAVCEKNFFKDGTATRLKDRGLKLIWSNEMMFPFDGEAEAAKNGLIDRALFVSTFQADAFTEMYRGVSSFITGNYIDPEDFPPCDRKNSSFIVGRLSRPDVDKYPLDLPAFYEELGLSDVCYRVMAWSSELERQYRWHKFSSNWELLPPNKEPVHRFLSSLDVFLYPLGHRIKESWGRAVVEAMLTGCVPVVPAGHQFETFMESGQTGFIFRAYHEVKAIMHELNENYALRKMLGQQCAEHARENLCNADKHRAIWIQALNL